MRRIGDRASGPLWAITSYYAFDDPPGGRRRLGVFREFRRRLNAPLVTVELSRDGEFHLGPDDTDVLVRIQGGALLWQKERLLNLAVEALPAECEVVAWVDGDILFDREDWADEALRLAESHALVHLFRRAHHLGPENFDVSGPYIRTCDSTACLLSENALPEAYFATETGLQGNFQCGIGWAARRELLERCGLYDGMILGSGDKVIFFAACGRSEAAVQAYRMSEPHARHYRAWARRFASEVTGRLGYVDCNSAHLWHGDLASRGYSDRYNGFESFGFDPYLDIGRGPSGAWEWTSDKPQLHAFTTRYFDRRRSG